MSWDQVLSFCLLDKTTLNIHVVLFFFPSQQLQGKKIFTTSVSFLSLLFHSFRHYNWKQFPFQNDTLSVSDAPRLRKSGSAGLKTEHRQSLFPLRDSLSQPAPLELPSAGSHDDCRSTRETVGRPAHSTLGGARFPGKPAALARPNSARLSSSGRGQRPVPALPKAANEAGSDTHAQTRPPRCYVRRVCPLSSASRPRLWVSSSGLTRAGRSWEHAAVVSRRDLARPRIPPPRPWSRVPHPPAAELAYGTGATRTHRGVMGTRGRAEGLRREGKGRDPLVPLVGLASGGEIRLELGKNWDRPGVLLGPLKWRTD